MRRLASCLRLPVTPERGLSARRAIALVALTVSLGACSSTAVAPIPSAAPSVGASSTPAASASPDLLELTKELYQAIADKDQPALTDASTALTNVGSDLASQQAALTAVASAESTFESDLAAAPWPATISPKTDAVIAATDKIARLAKGASTGDALTIAADLDSLRQAILDQGVAIAVLEAALGLPTS